jgi:hypothetical protein
MTWKQKSERGAKKMLPVNPPHQQLQTSVHSYVYVFLTYYTHPSPPSLSIPNIYQDIFNSTYYPRGEDTDCARKPWIVIDAAGLRLGRLSTLVATYLRGGNVATYSPSMNMGTYVVVINAEQVVVSGKKFDVGYKLSVVDP